MRKQKRSRWFTEHACDACRARPLRFGSLPDDDPERPYAAIFSTADFDRDYIMRDKRLKFWKVKLYFWRLDEPTELLAETEWHVIEGAADVFDLIESYCEAMYGVVLWELRKKYAKHSLNMMRSNLSSRGRARMNIAYDHEGVHHGVQVDFRRVRDEPEDEKPVKKNRKKRKSAA